MSLMVGGNVIKAVIYPRVSSRPQAEEGTSLETQRGVCEQLVRELGGEIVEVIPDEGVSGAKFLTRPGIQRALELIKSGTANTLVAYKVDRVARDLDICREIKRKVEAAGGQLLFADGSTFARNANGNMAFTLQAMMASWERETIRERFMEGTRKRAERDRVQVARTKMPMGYRIVRHADVTLGHYPKDLTGTYQVVEDEARLVRQMFGWYAAGESLYQIANRLNTMGVQTRQGAQMWRHNAVARILENPVYVGRPAFGRTETKSDPDRVGQLQGRRKIRNEEYLRKRDEAEWIVLSAPALVTEETWQEVQRRRLSNKATLGGNPDRRFLLSGLLRCPNCQRGIFGTTGGSGGRYYRCDYRRPALSSTDRCAGPYVRAAEVEACVLQAVRDLATRPEVLQRWMVEYNEEQQRGGEDPQMLREELAKVEQLELSTIASADQLLDLGASVEGLRKRFASIREDREALESRLVVAEEIQRKQVANPQREADRLALALRDLDLVLTSDQVRMKDRVALLTTVIEEIYVESGRYKVCFRGVNVFAYCQP